MESIKSDLITVKWRLHMLLGPKESIKTYRKLNFKVFCQVSTVSLDLRKKSNTVSKIAKS